jgi:hypothetical protein
LLCITKQQEEGAEQASSLIVRWPTQLCFMRKALVRFQQKWDRKSRSSVDAVSRRNGTVGMTEKQQAECTIESDGTGVFVVFEGVRIAKRGEPGTPQAGTWVKDARALSFGLSVRESAQSWKELFST